MFNIFGNTEDLHFHKDIWAEMMMSVKAANRQTKMVQSTMSFRFSFLMMAEPS